jgi:hypothetical protein
LEKKQNQQVLPGSRGGSGGRWHKQRIHMSINDKIKKNNKKLCNYTQKPLPLMFLYLESYMSPKYLVLNAEISDEFLGGDWITGALTL